MGPSSRLKMIQVRTTPNHDTHGIFIMRGPDLKGRGEREGLNLLDVAPTVLKQMGIGIPKDMEGRVIE